MSEPKTALLERIAQLDETFGNDRGEEMGEFFTLDARMMWPFMEAITGREAIQAAFVDFANAFTTLNWTPDRRLVHVHGDRAYVLGTFVEDRREKANGEAARVHGRLVEFWRLEEDGQWRVEALLTSRYAENEPLKGE